MSQAKEKSVKTGKEKLMSVLLAPHVSEKAAHVAEGSNQFVFRVRRDATKLDIKAAVELMFEVKVDAVQVVNVEGKRKRFGQRESIDSARRPSGQMIRTLRLQLAKCRGIVSDHFFHRQVRRQVLIDAPRPESVNRLIVTQLLHQLGVHAHIATERGQQNQGWALRAATQF